jgi:hypothetical protein
MRWWLLGVALISLSAPSAWGCGNGKVLFSDSFDTFQSAWGKPSDYAKVVDGRLQLSEVADKSYSIYAGRLSTTWTSAQRSGWSGLASRMPRTSA